MNISVVEANDLAREIVNAICRWRSFRSLLIGGGIETAFELKVGQVLDAWLEQKPGNLVLVPQHKAPSATSRRRVDYAICTDPGKGFDIAVDAVIEVKGNYASQSAELTGLSPRRSGCRARLPRLARAAIQATQYAEGRCSGASPAPPAFVIYLLVAASEAPPPGKVASGLAHFDRRFSDPEQFRCAVHQLQMKNQESAPFADAVTELGSFQNDRVFCGIFLASAPFCGLLSAPG